jgi:naphthoate synthase
VGEKRAREIWYLCELYDAETAERWGLVNKVVPAADLRAEVGAWAEKLLAKSPTALRFLKHSFNASSEPVAEMLAFDALELFQGTEEASEGPRAFVEKREPDFTPFR